MNEKYKEKMIEMGIDPSLVMHPDGIEEWLKLENHPILKKRTRVVSTGEEIDLGWLHHHFRKMIATLPTDEKVALEKLKDLYISQLGKASRAKQMVFGVNTKSKVTDIQSTKMLFRKQAEIIELFGRYFSTSEVLQIVVKDWGIPVSRVTLERFLEEHNEVIREKRELFKQSYSDVRLGYKRSRLDELSWIYKTLKGKYGESESREDLRLMLQVIKQIKEEVEVETLNVNINGGISIEHTINQHVKNELIITNNISVLVINKIAQKQGIDPNVLIHRMNTSFYKKYIKGELVNVDSTKLPSGQEYDFEKIKYSQKANDNELNQYLDTKEKQYEEELPEEALELRDKLLSAMNSKLSSIHAMRERVNLDFAHENKPDYIEYEDMDKDQPLKGAKGRKIKGE
jgi:hypothetical protein